MVTCAPFHNFGRNQTISPAAYYEPRSEQEVLSILNEHRTGAVRVVGKLHSWSDVVSADGIVLNLKHLQHLELADNDQAVWVHAGCQIKMLLAFLKQRSLTLPSVGLINEQTIAGAISTGTHGSGRHSLSHYVQAVRIARYHAGTGEAVIEEIAEGDALRAARCSLGALGVILSVKMECRPAYQIEEHFQEYASLDSVLSAETQYPLQQFFLAPWRWTYLAQHRREVNSPRSFLAGFFRWYWFVSIDLGLHLLILFAIRVVGRPGFVRFLFRRVIANTVIRNWRVIDDSAAMLVMEHELFRHIEMELFVAREQLSPALEFLKQVLIVADGSSDEIPRLQLDATDADRLTSLKGTYCHHYPICIRRVLEDDTLISMSSGVPGDSYAISLISYVRPAERQAFFDLCAFLASTMLHRFGARPHWGKLCPVSPEELAGSYPRFSDFRGQCESSDPPGRFRNRWLADLLTPSETRQS